MVSNPIYKDTFYTFSTDDTRFRIQVDGATVYEGRSKAKPDGVNKININRICANYLYNTFEGVELYIQMLVEHSPYRDLQQILGVQLKHFNSYGIMTIYQLSISVVITH